MFWRKRKERSGEGFTDQAAVKITNVMMRAQAAFARFMNRRTKGFSRRTWILLMIAGGLGWGLLSGYFILDAFRGQQASPVIYPARVIRVPLRKDSLIYWEEIYKNRKKI